MLEGAQHAQHVRMVHGVAISGQGQAQQGVVDSLGCGRHLKLLQMDTQGQDSP